MTERLRRSPYSIVLFDEIEKAHPDVVNVLLQVFEDGILTDAQGNTVDCRHAIFILTSNIGARQIQKRGNLGFQSGTDASREKLEEQVMSAVKQTFPPEFLNRLDETIIFDELTDADLASIIDLQIVELNTILEKRGIRLSITEEGRQWLLDKTCGDRSYGARPLKRALQKYVEDRLSDAMISGAMEGGCEVEISVENGDLSVRSLKADELEKFFVHTEA